MSQSQRRSVQPNNQLTNLHLIICSQRLPICWGWLFYSALLYSITLSNARWFYSSKEECCNSICQCILAVNPLTRGCNRLVFSQSTISRLSFTIGMVSGVSQKYWNFKSLVWKHWLKVETLRCFYFPRFLTDCVFGFS
jgi:hypothetical protein